jgi:hypothetical protein
MKATFRFFLLTFFLSTVAWSNQAQTKAEQQVLSVEQARVAALLRADTKQLNLVLADDLTYTHSSGRTDTKKELLASVTSASLKYEAIEPAETKVRLYGATAIVTGMAQLKINNKGESLSFALKFTGVYTKRDWQLVGYQSTRLPT